MFFAEFNALLASRGGEVLNEGFLAGAVDIVIESFVGEDGRQGSHRVTRSDTSNSGDDSP